MAIGSNTITTPVTDSEGAFTQLVAELRFRFGGKEQFYVGGRYNTVTGKLLKSDTKDLVITRVNAGAGWFISKNVLVKVEYMDQQYTGDAWTGRFAGAGFNGVNVEAAISF